MRVALHSTRLQGWYLEKRDQVNLGHAESIGPGETKCGQTICAQTKCGQTKCGQGGSRRMLPRGIVPEICKCGHSIQKWTFSLRGTNPSTYACDRLRIVTGRGATRAKDAQGTPTQSHISPSILVYEGKRAPSDSIGEEKSDWDRDQAIPRGIISGIFNSGNPGIAVLIRQLLRVYQTSPSPSGIASQCHAALQRRREGPGLRVLSHTMY